MQIGPSQLRRNGETRCPLPMLHLKVGDIVRAVPPRAANSLFQIRQKERLLQSNGLPNSRSPLLHGAFPKSQRENDAKAKI